MKQITFLLFVVLLAVSSFSCSKKDDDSPAPSTTSTGVFNAKIGSETVSTNNVFLAKVSAGGTQAFTATLADGRIFSSAIFPSQFPIGEAKNIAYSGFITYKVGDQLNIPVSGTMTFTVIQDYKRMKGTFSGGFTGGLEISGDFDISNP
jgi:hypothetical protein